MVKKKKKNIHLQTDKAVFPTGGNYVVPWQGVVIELTSSVHLVVRAQRKNR
jgi:hypothetical protein